MKRWAPLVLLTLVGCGSTVTDVDVVIRNGTVYDGTGGPPTATDIVVIGDRIEIIGDASGYRGRTEIDAQGLAVAPGFINMLSWATATLIADGRSESDIRQGVTLEVFGEGLSFGPLTDEMKTGDYMEGFQGAFRFDVEWTTLAEYLDFLERRGVSPNVASFIGASTVRIHEIGSEDRAPLPDELERMTQLVRDAMEQGAIGVGSSLIYAPAFYASTEELVGSPVPQPSTTGCTSRTSATKATVCSRPSTSS